MKNLHVTSDFIQGRDMASASTGHQIISEAIQGRNLMMNSDCKACHSITEKSIGPSFTEVAKRYKPDTRAHEYLTSKIIKGGSGVWGGNVMPAHLTMPEGDVRQIVTWILTLADAGNAKASLPASGKIVPALNEQKKRENVFRLIATYTDNGGAGGISPLAGSNAIYLRNNVMDVTDFTEVNGLAKRDSVGASYLVLPPAQGWLKGQQLDLNGISRIELTGISGMRPGAYQVEVRSGKPTGTVIGQATMNLPGNRQRATASIPLQKNGNGNGEGAGPESLQDIYILIRQQQAGGRALLKTISFIPE